MLNRRRQRREVEKPSQRCSGTVCRIRLQVLVEIEVKGLYNRNEVGDRGDRVARGGEYAGSKHQVLPQPPVPGFDLTDLTGNRRYLRRVLDGEGPRSGGCGAEPDQDLPG